MDSSVALYAYAALYQFAELEIKDVYALLIYFCIDCYVSQGY